ncbi:MAG: hypothetical protein QM731_11375 [Chitinophagaceae bacterium]
MRGLFFGSCLLLCGSASLYAQDTTKRKTIDVTSTFKPVLREASKINFSAVAPAADTSKPRLSYNIPSQNLFFSYMPAELKPVALQMDSVSIWDYSNFIKAGIGNVHQPYLKAGFSFGDGKSTFFNIFASHYTSKGSRTYQKNNSTAVGAAVTYKTKSNLELNGSLGFSSDDYFLYGYQPDTLKYEKSDLRRRFQTIEGKIDLRNTVPTEFGLTYHPSLKVSVFGDGRTTKGSEANTVLALPLEKTFGEDFTFGLGAIANLTNYRLKGLSTGKNSINNNLYQVPVALSYKSDNFYIHGGIIPSWEKKDFSMLPNIMADITTSDKKLTLQLGWIGYFEKGSYQRFASINPWLSQPDSVLLNTKVTEIYGGLKGSLGDHFSYSAKFGYLRYNNTPLFVNDYNLDTTGKQFSIVYEPKMDVARAHGEVAYTVGEKFSASAGVTYSHFAKLKNEEKAWGMIPVEYNVGLRWQLIRNLWLNSEIWAFDGIQYRDKKGAPSKDAAGFDMSAGVEFQITKNFNLWVQLNNLFNNEYQRWHQYHTYGFNILGGITYSFNQKRK